MKDFPMFTTENGVSSLILKEIPYRKEAYITLRDSRAPEALLQECADFCRACGAKKVYATGHPAVERYPLHTAMLEMRGIPNVEEALIESLFPVTEATVSRWRALYNEAMFAVDNAGTLERREIYNAAFSHVYNASTQESRDEAAILRGNTYFVHRQGELLGIGWLGEDTIEAIAAVKPGMGKRVLHSLCSVCPGVPLRLEVASENRRAIALYEKTGFIKTRELSRWYCIEK